MPLQKTEKLIAASLFMAPIFFVLASCTSVPVAPPKVNPVPQGSAGDIWPESAAPSASASLSQPEQQACPWLSQTRGMWTTIIDEGVGGLFSDCFRTGTIWQKSAATAAFKCGFFPVVAVAAPFFAGAGTPISLTADLAEPGADTCEAQKTQTALQGQH